MALDPPCNAPEGGSCNHSAFPLWIWTTLPLVASLLSGCGSMCMLSWLRIIAERHRKKLMARQLWHLALADIGGVVVYVSGQTIDALIAWLPHGQLPRPLLRGTCTYIFGNNLFTLTSMLIEVHIALTTALAIRRCNRAVAALSSSLGVLWVLGFALGISVIYFDNVAWDEELHTCRFTAYSGEYVKSGVLTLGVVVCICAYIYGGSLANQSGSMAATARLWSRAKHYTLVSVFTNGPFCIWNLLAYVDLWTVPTISHIYLPAWFISFAVLCLNGVLNAIVYSGHCRYVRQVIQNGQAEPLDVSLHSWHSSAHGPQWQSWQSCPHGHERKIAGSVTSSFSVRFGESEVTEVKDIHAEAKTQATQDLVTLMASRDDVRSSGVNFRVEGSTLVMSRADGRADGAVPGVQDLEEHMYSVVLGCYDEVLDANAALDRTFRA